MTHVLPPREEVPLQVNRAVFIWNRLQVDVTFGKLGNLVLSLLAQ
jgi:hypothetical protein